MEELEVELDKLNGRQKKLATNRNLCIIVVVFLGYSAWPLIKDGTAPIFFIVAMSAIILAVVGVATYGHLNIKKLKSEIQELEAKKAAAEQAAAAESTSDEDND